MRQVNYHACRRCARATMRRELVWRFGGWGVTVLALLVMAVKFPPEWAVIKLLMYGATLATVLFGLYDLRMAINPDLDTDEIQILLRDRVAPLLTATGKGGRFFTQWEIENTFTKKPTDWCEIAAERPDGLDDGEYDGEATADSGRPAAPEGQSPNPIGFCARRSPAENRPLRDHDGEDALGEPYAIYDAWFRAVVCGFVGVVILALGAGGLLYGVPREEEGLAATLIGGLLVCTAPVFLTVSVKNLRSKFEVRRKGIRYCSWGKTLEMLMDDLRWIEVNQFFDSILDNPSNSRFGLTVGFSSSEIKIIGRNNANIVLGPRFLSLVRNSSGLVKLLESHSNLDIGGGTDSLGSK